MGTRRSINCKSFRFSGGILAKGKHQYDKREAIKRREQNREIERVMKHY